MLQMWPVQNGGISAVSSTSANELPQPDNLYQKTSPLFLGVRSLHTEVFSYTSTLFSPGRQV